MKNIFKALILASVVTSVYAENGSFNGTVDMNMNMPCQKNMNVERIPAEPLLKGRDELAVGGFKVTTDSSSSVIELRGRRD